MMCIMAKAAQSSNIRSDGERGDPVIGEENYQTKMQLPPLDIFSKFYLAFMSLLIYFITV